MNKEEFEQAFDSVVAEPLAQLGFKSVGRSLHAFLGDAEVAVIRLGGRMSRQGAVAHIICGRKTWLRTREETVPQRFVREVFDYPFKLRPSDLLKGTLAYAPSNLNYEYDVLHFEATAADSVIRELSGVRDAVEVFSAWLAALPAESLLQQLETRGEDAWIERIWIDDCRARVGK